MSKNLYFNNFNNTAEQNLIEDLVIESISIYGHDVYFIPRTLNNKDEIYGEDQLSSYNSAHDTEVYINSYDSYEGDGTFLSKFNLEIRDQIKFTIARRTFLKEIGITADLSRPKEGDLIYSKMMKRLFIIKYVNNTSFFYQLGALQTWELTCEVFEYSNEILNTGITDIDEIQTKYSFAGANNTLLTNSEYSDVLSDVFETNTEFQNKTSGLIDWTNIDPFSSGNV